MKDSEIKVGAEVTHIEARGRYVVTAIDGSIKDPTTRKWHHNSVSYAPYGRTSPVYHRTREDFSVSFELVPTLPEIKFDNPE